MSDALLGHGTLIRFVPYDAAATIIGGLDSIGGMSLSAESVDVTTHQSTDRYREFIQGLRDGGEVPVEGNFLPGDAGQAALLSALNSSSPTKEMEILFPDGAGWRFQAFPTGFETDAPVDDALPLTGGLKVTGKPLLGTTQTTGLTDPWFVLSDGDASVDPAKASDTYSYTADVANAIASLTVTPTSSGGDTIYVQGEEVASGVASSSISLEVGENVIVVVVEKAGETPARYEITVTRAAA